MSRVQQARGLPPLPPVTEPHLQEAVFTHSSANDAKNLNVRGYRADELNYERLEFLGDAYIEIIASRLLYSRFPDMEPSHQSYLRELLVKNETLGQFSAAYGLGDRLKHGTHVRYSKNWPKILADVFEAYVAAVILSNPESGYDIAESWLTELWAPKLLEFKVKPVENRKARDDLNKLVMGKGIKLDYREERDMLVAEGQQKFFIGVYLTGWGFHNEWLGSGEGQNKSQACVFAAMDALENRPGIIARANARKLEVYPPKALQGVVNGGHAAPQGGQ
jgi:ribonuclease-3